MALGMGVMIRALSGADYESAKAVQAAIGKRVVSVDLVSGNPDELRIVLDDGSTLVLWDDGQSCCESRYMLTDDDVTSFVGSTLRGVEVREAPNAEDDGYDTHEVAFLAVQTDGGDLVCSTHNEHNGYYGGFSIAAKLSTPEPRP